MVLEKFTYYNKKKKIKIYVKHCKSLWSKLSGLMFKNKSLPLLFVFNKEKNLSIHSFFCKPFKAIWLDKNKNVLKIIYVNKWKFNLSGRGKYLLEIPL